MLLPITLTLAGAAALLHIWLSLRVSLLRRPLKVSIGDGGHETLARRIRAHSNFAENMPLFVILLALVETATGGNLWLWGAALLFVLARIAHAFGMDRGGANWLRAAGIMINWAVLLTLGFHAILLAYQSPATQSGIEISPGRSASLG